MTTPTGAKTSTSAAKESGSAAIPPRVRRLLEQEARRRGLSIPKTGQTTNRSDLWAPQDYPPSHALYGLPHPQQVAYESPATILCYGGAAGGGKSALSIGTAVTQHHACTIFRRQSTQLGDLVEYAKSVTEGYRTGFNGSTNRMSLPDGAFIEFAGLNEPDDWMNWKGRRRDFLGFDEATEFLRSQVMSLIGWLGSVKPGQRLRMVLTFNPPSTPEGEWINELLAPWLDKEHPQKPPHPFEASDGDVRWFVQEGDPERPDSNRVVWVAGPELVDVERADGTTEQLYPTSVTFIRAKVTDNSYLTSDDNYLRSLMALPEPLRSQALYGKWNAGKTADPWQALPTALVQAAQARWKPEGRQQPLSGMGVDVAHGGADRTVLAPKHGLGIPESRWWIDTLTIVEGRDTPDGESAAQLVVTGLEQAGEAEPSRLINVDALGYGARCASVLARPAPEGYALSHVQTVLAQEKSTYTDGKLRCANVRAEMYWRLRKALEAGLIDLPPGNDLLRDLCAVRYKILSGGVIQLEKKDEVKKRLGRSPDLADGVALSMLPAIQAAGKSIAMPPDLVIGGTARPATRDSISRPPNQRLPF